MKEQRWFWSDMMATSCTKVVQPIDQLEAIWRYCIANTTTRDLNLDILKRHKFQPKEHGNFLEIPLTSEDFHALLATDNRKGLCRMLASYPAFFNYAFIHRVRVYNAKTLCFLIKHEPPPPPPPPPPPDSPYLSESCPSSPLSKKQKRKSKSLQHF